MSFASQLNVTQINSNKWMLNRPLVYTSSITGVIEVPVGFVSDFASVPRIPFIYVVCGGLGDRAAVLHDYIYRHRLFTRKICDQIYYQAMLDDDVDPYRAWLLYIGVRVFGCKFYQQGM